MSSWPEQIAEPAQCLPGPPDASGDNGERDTSCDKSLSRRHADSAGSSPRSAENVADMSATSNHNS